MGKYKLYGEQIFSGRISGSFIWRGITVLPAGSLYVVVSASGIQSITPIFANILGYPGVDNIGALYVTSVVHRTSCAINVQSAAGLDVAIMWMVIG